MTKNEYLKYYLSVLPPAQAVFRAIEAEALAKYEINEPILDFGCGNGLFSVAFLAKKKEIIGVDINKIDMLEAKKRGIYKKLVSYDGQTLPFKDNQFKSVVANSVLEHIYDINLVLKEINRVLAKDGSLLFSAPSEKRERLYLIYRLLNYFGLKKLAVKSGRFMDKSFVHYNCFSGEKWEKELKNAGFTEVNYEYRASEKIALVSDLLLIFAPLDILEKKLFGRYLGWRKYVSKIIYLIVKNIQDKVKKNNGVVIVVQAIK